jgi:hypothetical protein
LSTLEMLARGSFWCERSGVAGGPSDGDVGTGTGSRRSAHTIVLYDHKKAAT